MTLIEAKYKVLQERFEDLLKFTEELYYNIDPNSKSESLAKALFALVQQYDFDAEELHGTPYDNVQDLIAESRYDDYIESQID